MIDIFLLERKKIYILFLYNIFPAPWSFLYWSEAPATVWGEVVGYIYVKKKTTR